MQTRAGGPCYSPIFRIVSKNHSLGLYGDDVALESPWDRKLELSLAGMEPRMLDVAAELTRKWGVRKQ